MEGSNLHLLVLFSSLVFAMVVEPVKGQDYSDDDQSTASVNTAGHVAGIGYSVDGVIIGNGYPPGTIHAYNALRGLAEMNGFYAKPTEVVVKSKYKVENQIPANQSPVGLASTYQPNLQVQYHPAMMYVPLGSNVNFQNLAPPNAAPPQLAPAAFSFQYQSNRPFPPAEQRSPEVPLALQKSYTFNQQQESGYAKKPAEMHTFSLPASRYSKNPIQHFPAFSTPTLGYSKKSLYNSSEVKSNAVLPGYTGFNKHIKSTKSTYAYASPLPSYKKFYGTPAPVVLEGSRGRFS